MTSTEYYAIAAINVMETVIYQYYNNCYYNMQTLTLRDCVIISLCIL